MHCNCEFDQKLPKSRHICHRWIGVFVDFSRKSIAKFLCRVCSIDTTRALNVWCALSFISNAHKQIPIDAIRSALIFISNSTWPKWLKIKLRIAVWPIRKMRFYCTLLECCDVHMINFESFRWPIPSVCLWFLKQLWSVQVLQMKFPVYFCNHENPICFWPFKLHVIVGDIQKKASFLPLVLMSSVML